jgi:hypothetical protein
MLRLLQCTLPGTGAAVNRSQSADTTAPHDSSQMPQQGATTYSSHEKIKEQLQTAAQMRTTESSTAAQL